MLNFQGLLQMRADPSLANNEGSSCTGEQMFCKCFAASQMFSTPPNIFEGSTALMFAAHAGREDVCKALLEVRNSFRNGRQSVWVALVETILKPLYQTAKSIDMNRFNGSLKKYYCIHLMNVFTTRGLRIGRRSEPARPHCRRDGDEAWLPKPRRRLLRRSKKSEEEIGLLYVFLYVTSNYLLYSC